MNYEDVEKKRLEYVHSIGDLRQLEEREENLLEEIHNAYASKKSVSICNLRKEIDVFYSDYDAARNMYEKARNEYLESLEWHESEC